MLTDAVADQLVSALAAGENLNDAARGSGISPRVLRLWRSRAYSTRAEDARFIELERRVLVALGRAQAGKEKPKSEPWEEAARQLEDEFPERWALLPDEYDLF